MLTGILRPPYRNMFFIYIPMDNFTRFLIYLFFFKGKQSFAKRQKEGWCEQRNEWGWKISLERNMTLCVGVRAMNGHTVKQVKRATILREKEYHRT